MIRDYISASWAISGVFSPLTSVQGGKYDMRKKKVVAFLDQACVPLSEASTKTPKPETLPDTLLKINKLTYREDQARSLRVWKRSE